MGLKYRKSIKIAPGVRLNLGSRSSSISFGGKGCRYTINTRGRTTATIGIPGTGISYSSSSNVNQKQDRLYNSQSYSNQRAIQKQLREQQKLEEQRRNELLVKEYETHIELIQNVHKECEPDILWEDIANSSEPFPYGFAGPNETVALEKYKAYEPTFKEKLLHIDVKKRQELYDAISVAKALDIDDYNTWKDSVEFAKRIISGDIDAYYEALQEANPFEDLIDFGSGFEFGTDDYHTMEIEFIVKSDSVVPQKSKSLTKTGKLSEKNLSKSVYYDILQDYVCSCTIRLARELFALLPINFVIVHAVDNTLNTVTGTYEFQTILSVKFLRDRFDITNFDNIDASDFTESFEHNMIFKKTSGFKPVKRIDRSSNPTASVSSSVTKPTPCCTYSPDEVLRTKWGTYEMPDPYVINIAKGPRTDLKKISE